MSLSLDIDTVPKGLVVTSHYQGHVTLDADNGHDIHIGMKDFVALVEYVLTNTDLMENDPRLELVMFCKELKQIPGFNANAKRLG